jgi:ABC-type multidrug transport system fused ATPase/permease subunit
VKKDEKAQKPKITKESWLKARRIFKYIKPYRALYFTSLGVLLIGGLISMTFPALMGKLFGSTTTKGDFNLFDFSSTQSVVTLLFTIFALQSIFSFLRIYLTSIVTENVLADIRREAFSKLVTLPITFYNKNKTGELTSRISADIGQLQETFNTILAEFIRQFIVIIVGVTFLAFISWKLVFIMLGTIPVMAIVAVFFGRFIKKISRQAQDKVAESNSLVEESLTAITSVKAFANEYLEIVRYGKVIDEVKNLGIKGALWRGFFVSFIIFCMFGSIVFVIWQGVLMKDSGDLTLDQLVSFVMYSVFIGASFGSIPELYSKIQSAIGATERLMEILDEKSEEVEILSPVKSGRRLLGKVEFIQVGFHYESRPDIEVLKNITFKVEPGMQVAIVGPSGSGKSTLAALLLRFYNPATGEIKYDGNNIQSLALSEMRGQMALVPQEVILYSGTISENISYGKPGSTEHEIREAARKANALEFIDRFPDKFNTVVGERGIQLSGGQRQRIAIARAVLKDPSILILDEATSSLDSESERLVQEALEKLMQGRTSFVIAHRLSTVKNADIILVIENGVLVEAGKHDQLVQNENGLYKKLSSLQFVEH